MSDQIEISVIHVLTFGPNHTVNVIFLILVNFRYQVNICECLFNIWVFCPQSRNFLLNFVTFSASILNCSCPKRVFLERASRESA